jgi:hypothetical protein
MFWSIHRNFMIYPVFDNAVRLMMDITIDEDVRVLRDLHEFATPQRCRFVEHDWLIAHYRKQVRGYAP